MKHLFAGLILGLLFSTPAIADPDGLGHGWNRAEASEGAGDRPAEKPNKEEKPAVIQIAIVSFTVTCVIETAEDGEIKRSEKQAGDKYNDKFFCGPDSYGVAFKWAKEIVEKRMDSFLATCKETFSGVVDVKVTPNIKSSVAQYCPAEKK